MSNEIKKLMPITSANGNLVDENGEIAKVKYLPGYPRQYRFDASKGLFNIKGEINLTRKGEALVIIPIAYRVFKDNILGEQYGLLKWAEFFFLNEKKQVCALLIHGYSVENLMRIVDEMFYDDASFCDVRLEIKPVEKTSKSPAANGAKYWLAEFSYEVLTDDEKLKLQAVTKGFHFWREDTKTGNEQRILDKNYSTPEPKKEIEGTPEPETA